MSRDDFSAPIKKLMAERVGFHCSNPSCGVATIGPGSSPDQREYVGVAAHIYSASPDNGPRANPSLSRQERSSIENGIHLCAKCSTIIDKNNGAGYPDKILFNWKKCAETEAKNRIYQNNSYTLFKQIKFLNLEQHYSTALTCTKLNDKNVASCPANNKIINDISNKLTLANKCILRGPSGSGKSLLTYQTAYELHKKKWTVFNLDKRLVSTSTILAAPVEKSLIIIDDAQTIEPQHLENILDNAYEDCLVLVNWNSSTSFNNNFLNNFPCVDVILSSQIKILKTYCLDNKQRISNLLQKIGIKIDQKDYYSCIETRIQRASNEKSPWLFNYNLTEGWHAAQNDIQLLKDNEFLNLVIVTVAIYQIATLDNGVQEEVILSDLKSFKDDNFWLCKAQKTLANYCTKTEGLIKNKHYEYSRKVLKLSISNKNSQCEDTYILNVLKKALQSSDFEKGHSNILELIMFEFGRMRHQLVVVGFIHSLTKDLLTSKDKMHATPAKITKLNSLIRFDKNSINTLKQHQDILENWILNCSRETAFPLADLANTLYNEKYDSFPSGTFLIDLLISKVVSADIDDKSRFSRLLDRSHLHFSDADRSYADKILSNTDFNIDLAQYSGGIACYQFASLVINLSGISLTWANRQIENNIDGMANLLNQNLMAAYKYFHDLFNFYFGVVNAILGGSNNNPKLKKIGRKLSKNLQVNAILQGFETVEAVNIQNYSDILIFMALYNKTKLKEVSDKFNYSRLEKLYEDDTDLDHYHRGIICILHNPDSVLYMKYLSQVITNSSYIDSVLFGLNPDLALMQLQRGIAYKCKCTFKKDYVRELMILNHIKDNINVAFLKKIITENHETIAKSIFSESQNIDNDKAKFEFLIFIHVNCPELMKVIFKDHTKNGALVEKITRLIKGKAHEKNMARLYVYFLKHYVRDPNKKIHALEKRYSSIKNFDVKNISNDTS